MKGSFIESRGGVLLGGCLIAAAAVAAYSNSFSGPFVFDDLGSIPGNPSIGHLWPIWAPLAPPAGLTVSGRPVLNLTLAFNHSISGTKVWSYHALNLFIHVSAGLALFGVIRRTFLRCRALHLGTTAVQPTLFAFLVALLWTLHPLQTESVTYVIQRAESLMGLFYLLTLYCFIRGVEHGGPAALVGRSGVDGGLKVERAVPSALGAPSVAGGAVLSIWFWLSFICCLLGMATKEVMVSAPVIVFLYDRTFVAGSFGEAWRRRRGFYLALFGTWALLAWLVAGAGSRGGSVGFGGALSALGYAKIQVFAVVRYLRLTAWPHPLVFYYGMDRGGSPLGFALDLAIVSALAATTAAGLYRHSAWGFVGVWFFAILAPTSSVIPVGSETIAEHRMYLALAPALAVIVWLVLCGCGRRIGPAILLSGGIGLAGLTFARNEAYRSDLGLWAGTVAEVPANPIAHNDLGEALRAAGRLSDARVQFEEALRLSPGLADAWNNLGIALTQLGHPEDAIPEFERALQIKPDYAAAHLNWGGALLQMGSPDRAIAQYEDAVRLEPDSAAARFDLGKALLQVGQFSASVDEFRQSLRLEPSDAEAHNNLGAALADLGRWGEAKAEFEQALLLRPDYAVARANLDRLGALRTGPDPR